jgi:6-phosphogluconolactonase (cycloisomerase 2 family)
MSRVAVFAGVGKTLCAFGFDPETGGLTLRQTVDDLANDCHYVAVHPNGRVLYAAQSETPPPKGRPLVSAISAFAIDGAGALARLGPSHTPPLLRAVHLSVDKHGRFLLMAHNFTESVSVLRLHPDGRLGEPVTQTAEASGLGFLVHQIRVDPSNRWVFVPVRGDDPPLDKPGHLVLFRMDSDGVLSGRQIIDFPRMLGPRHVDFHPSKPLVYLAVERGNLLIAYRHDDGVLTERFRASTLEEPCFLFPDQRAGAVRVHPGGRFLYVTNRNIAPCPATGTCREDHVFSGGENSVAVFALDVNTGQPTLLQHVSAHGFEPRTMTIDPTGRFLIVANHKTVTERRGDHLVTVAPNLSVFGIAANGTLSYLRSYDQPGEAWWVGAVALK